MDTIDIFLDIFKRALPKVSNDYYGLHWWYERMLNNHFGEAKNGEREIIQEYLDRYGERVFCYEFYHQIRILMDEYSLEQPNTFQEIKLQGELRKDYIGEIIQEYFNVQALEKEYIPDFLLHTPGNFDNQLLIIEVKSNPEITFSGMNDDLLKIQQFINRYRYECGVFLTINSNPDSIKRSLNRNDSLSWLNKNINTPERIHIMCIQNKDSELFETTIEQLLKS